MQNQETWLVNLKLNSTDFNRDTKKAEDNLNKVGKNASSNLASDLKLGISGIGSGLSRDLSTGNYRRVGNQIGGLLALGMIGALSFNLLKSLPQIVSKDLSNLIKISANIPTNVIKSVNPAGGNVGFAALVASMNKVGNLNSLNKNINSIFNNILNKKNLLLDKLKDLSPNDIFGKIDILGKAIQLRFISWKTKIAQSLLSKSGGDDWLSNLASRFASQGSKLGEGLSGLTGAFASPWAAAAAGVAAFVAAIALAKPILLSIELMAMKIGMPFLQAYANIEQMRISLSRVGLNPAQIKGVEQLAKLPGLNREQAVTGTAKLMASGFDLEQSKAMVVGFSRLTTSADQYGRVMLAISQILGKDELSAEELNNQLAESIPGFQAIIKKMYGVSNAEQLRTMGIKPKEFVTKLAQYSAGINTPATTAQSSIDNLADAMENLKSSIGKGISVGLIPFIGVLTNSIDNLVESGKLEKLGQSFASIFTGANIEQALNGMLSIANGLVQVGKIASYLFQTFSLLGDTISNALSGLSNFVSKIIQIGGRLAGLPIIGAIFDRISAGLKLIDIVNNVNLNKAGGDAAAPDIKNILDKLASQNATQNGDKERNDLLKDQLDKLREVANNTRKDTIQRAILGGGNLGAMGVTPYELTQSGRSRGNSLGTRVERAMFDLLDAISQQINDSTRNRNTAGFIF